MQPHNNHYIKKTSHARVINTERWFTPLLIIFPLLVSGLMIGTWYFKGYTQGIQTYNTELMIGVLILSINILFDIPFIKALSINQQQLGLFYPTNSKKNREDKHRSNQ